MGFSSHFELEEEYDLASFVIPLWVVLDAKLDCSIVRSSYTRKLIIKVLERVECQRH
jgi:hypothetical protein